MNADLLERLNELEELVESDDLDKESDPDTWDELKELRAMLREEKRGAKVETAARRKWDKAQTVLHVYLDDPDPEQAMSFYITDRSELDPIMADQMWDESLLDVVTITEVSKPADVKWTGQCFETSADIERRRAEVERQREEYAAAHPWPPEGYAPAIAPSPPAEIVPAVTRYEPEDQVTDLVAQITGDPDGDPVQEYLDTLKSAASVSTMEQALGVVVALLSGVGRPENHIRQSPKARHEAAQKMKQAAHNYKWFRFDGRQAKALIAALSRENYADASREKMVAAVVGTLDEVEAINVQAQLDALGRLDDMPLPAAQKKELMQTIELFFGRRALTTQAAKIEIKKSKNADRKARDGVAKAQPAQPATLLPIGNDPDQPQRKRRKGTIDRSTKGLSKHRQLTKRELRALWAVCAQGGEKGARDMVIIALGFGAGLRRSEIAALQFSDIEWDGKVSGRERADDEQTIPLPLDGASDDDTAGVAYLPVTIRHGKGDKLRVVTASNGTRQALLQWRKVRGDDPGPLLYSIDRWTGVQKGKGIDSQVIYTVCDELATRAGVKKFSPHDMRRTFISGFLDATGDISMAAQLAGHANIQTTTIYDRRGDDAKAKATIEHVHVPFEQVTVQEKLEQAQE